MAEEHRAILHFINRLILAGDYVDEKGRKYRFTREMQFVAPQDSFAYELIVDAAS